MGDYTRLKLKARLGRGTPPEAIKHLCAIVNGDEQDHPHYSVLCSGSGAGYFPGADGKAVLGRITDGSFALETNSSFKNHGNDLDGLLQWLGQHLDHPEGDKVGEVEVEGWDVTRKSMLIWEGGRLVRVCDPLV